jgi:hypothetical protein
MGHIPKIKSREQETKRTNRRYKIEIESIKSTQVSMQKKSTPVKPYKKEKKIK